MKYVIVWLLLMAHLVSTAQTSGAGQAPSMQADKCSFVAVGYVSNVKIVCNDIPQKDAQRIVQTLNKIVNETGEINPKLDRIQAALETMKAENALHDFGNLKERAIEFSSEIKEWFESRKEYFTPAVKDPDRFVQWEINTSSYFVTTYWHEVVQMREEFAAHNLRDPDLDSIIDRITSIKESLPLEQLEQLHPNDPSNSLVYTPNGAEILGIANSFAGLAAKLPDQPHERLP